MTFHWFHGGCHIFGLSLKLCVLYLLILSQRQGSVVLEMVGKDGKELPGAHGRIMNPGKIHLKPQTETESKTETYN